MNTGERSKQVRQVAQHRAAVAWWLQVAAAFPAGVVPVPTAARILGVTPNRVRLLIAEGRIRLVEGMPGGSERDRFVPVVDLVDAPFRMERGRPGVFGPKKRYSEDFLMRDPIRAKRLRVK